LGVVQSLDGDLDVDLGVCRQVQPQQVSVGSAAAPD